MPVSWSDLRKGNIWCFVEMPADYYIYIDCGVVCGVVWCGVLCTGVEAGPSLSLSLSLTLTLVSTIVTSVDSNNLERNLCSTKDHCQQ